MLRLMFAFVGCVLCFTGQSSAETWVDASGVYRIEAKFVKLENDQLTLEKPDGKLITLPLSRLSSDSVLMAKQMSEKATPGHPAKELGDQPSIHEFVEYYNTNVVPSIDPLAILATFPKSQRASCYEVLELAIKKIDPKAIQTAANLIRTSHKLLVNKHDFLINGLEAEGAGSKEEITGFVSLIAPLLAAVQDCSLLNPPLTGTFSGEQFLDKEYPKISEPLCALIESANFPPRGPRLAPLEVVSVDGDRARVLATGGTPPRDPETWVRLEDRWVKEQTVQTWPQTLLQIRTQVESTLDDPGMKATISGVMGIVDTLIPKLDELLQAEDQSQFNQKLAVCKQFLQGVIPPGALGALPR